MRPDENHSHCAFKIVFADKQGIQRIYIPSHNGQEPGIELEIK